MKTWGISPTPLSFGLGILLARFLGILIDEIYDAFHECMAQTFFNGALAPFVLDDFSFALLLHGIGEFDQSLRCVGFAV